MDQRHHAPDDQSGAELPAKGASARRDVEFAALVLPARGGDSAALAELLGGLRDYLLAVAQGELNAELRAKLGPSDLVQDTFLQAQRRFANFAGTTDHELRAWLRQILLNRTQDVRTAYLAEKRDINREIPIDAAGSAIGPIDELPLDTSTPSGYAVAGEADARVAAALDALPVDYRQVVWLRNWQGLEFNDIGREMGRSPDAARKLFSRAIAKLGALLERSDGQRPETEPR